VEVEVEEAGGHHAVAVVGLEAWRWRAVVSKSKAEWRGDGSGK
jgi:hypothetical protein